MSLESPGTGGTSIRLSLHETKETYPCVQPMENCLNLYQKRGRSLLFLQIKTSECDLPILIIGMLSPKPGK